MKILSSKKMNNKITVFFLSCKRFKLFSETFKSFWGNCLDIDLIKSFIIIDDNSDPSDQEKILKLGNSINLPSLILFKNQFKGQAISLNQIYNICDTKYAFSVEDDWKFKKSGNFLRSGLEILQNYSYIKRVCVDLSSSGKKLDYFNNKVLKTEYKDDYVIDEYEDKCNWPSFTFRQSLIDIEDCKQNIGYHKLIPEFSHDKSPPTTETDYAVRYCNFGYRTAFFVSTYVEETSKNFSSSFDLNKVNRYHEYDN
jgi:hypothetical protein